MLANTKAIIPLMRPEFTLVRTNIGPQQPPIASSHSQLQQQQTTVYSKEHIAQMQQQQCQL
jgi:hypothetical protein